MQLLPKIYLHDNKYTFYDMDAKTMLELASTLHGAMNALIADYNAFVDNTNKLLEDFMNDANADREVFETAMRQEFQDFVDVIDLKVIEQDNKIDDAVTYMKTNLINSALGIIEQALSNKEISMSTNYDEETEALSFVYVNA